MLPSRVLLLHSALDSLQMAIMDVEMMDTPIMDGLMVRILFRLRH